MLNDELLGRYSEDFRQDDISGSFLAWDFWITKFWVPVQLLYKCSPLCSQVRDYPLILGESDIILKDLGFLFVSTYNIMKIICFAVLV